MTTYKIGDMNYLLKYVIAIGKTGGYDANRITTPIWVISGKTDCTIDAVGDERNEDSTGGIDSRFRERAYKEFEDLRTAWEDINKVLK